MREQTTTMVERRGVVRTLASAPVSDSDDFTGPAPDHNPVGQDSDDQPVTRVAEDSDHEQAGDGQRRIGAGATERIDASTPTYRDDGVTLE